MCLPDGWCPGVPVGGLTPRGLKGDFHTTEGPSERDIETMEVRAVSSADGNEFIDWVAGVWYENANHRRGSRIPRLGGVRFTRAQFRGARGAAGVVSTAAVSPPSRTRSYSRRLQVPSAKRERSVGPVWASEPGGGR